MAAVPEMILVKNKTAVPAAARNLMILSAEPMFFFILDFLND
jgi:hypothetical protein